MTKSDDASERILQEAIQICVRELSEAVRLHGPAVLCALGGQPTACTVEQTVSRAWRQFAADRRHGRSADFEVRYVQGVRPLERLFSRKTAQGA